MAAGLRAASLHRLLPLGQAERRRRGRGPRDHPVEDINGEVILVAGGDDKVWPSSEHAKAIAARRQKHGIDTTIVEDPAAGHPVLFPGEPPKETRRSYQVGGDDGAPQRLGRQAWPVLQAALHLFR